MPSRTSLPYCSRIRVNEAYNPAAWHDFFILIGGAAATLSGLVFVAVSLHLREVLDNSLHRGRAGITLFTLVMMLVIATFGLIPGQPREGLGIEWIMSSIFLVTVGVVGFIGRSPEEKRLVAVRASFGMLANLAVGVAGITLILESGGGIYWLPPAVITGFSYAAVNSWLLMTGVATAEER